MSAPDTRESGAWRSDIPQEKSVTQSYRLVTQPGPDPKEKLDYLRVYLGDLRKNLEDKEDAIRYIINYRDNNMSEASGGQEDILQTIAADVRETKTKINVVEQEIGSLSINFDRLSTRMQNTEHHLGLNPSAETMPVPTCRPRLTDRTFGQLQLQQQQQQQGPNPSSSANASPSVTAVSALMTGISRRRLSPRRDPPWCTTKASQCLFLI